jgi:DNA-binding MarR family transcriptional regulator
VTRRRDPAEFIERFGAVKRSLHALAAQAYGAAGIGSTQVRFLRHIGRHTRISQADLARATETDPALTGRALQTLLDRGWVRRERSTEDRREYLLELGPPGRRALAKVEQLRADLAARVVEPLDERDLEDFERIANKLLAALGPRAGEGGEEGRSSGRG